MNATATAAAPGGIGKRARSVPRGSAVGSPGWWTSWMVTFLAFPIGGLAARLAVGPLDDPAAAAVGGVLAGAAVGTAQWVVLRGRIGPAWVAATAVGLAVGTLAGSGLLGYATNAGDLALQGAIAGMAVGSAQAFALPAGAEKRWRWVLLAAVAWALGWVVTTAAGVDVGQRFHVFGATGAIAYTALTGFALTRSIGSDNDQRLRDGGAYGRRRRIDRGRVIRPAPKGGS